MPEPAVPDQGYDERLGVPLRWWAQGVMLLATFWLAFVVAIPGAVPWVITGVLGLVLVVVLAVIGSARVGVTDGVLQAGRARIGLEHVGQAEPLDAAATQVAMGAGADARAFLLMRPYLKQAVRVPVIDPADRTPYWLLGSRHPDALAAAINSGASRPR